MKKIKNLLFVLLVATICCLSAMLVACSTRSDPSTHTHTYSTQWAYDENYHWHNATCGHTAEINGRATHIYNGDVCSVCNYKKSGSEDPDNPDNPQKVFKTVSFNLNGGNGSLDNMQFAVGEVMATLPSPTRDGYTFICWEIPYIGEEYTSASVMPNRDLQLSARWEKNITGYSDEYVSFKPSSEGVKDSLIREMYRDEVDKFVYVEITSDDLGGIDNVGKQNNFNLRTLEGMQYSVKSGYTWAWYQGNFDTPNGAQRFTLRYGSNIQFVTISDNSGVVQQTYLLDIYVKHDYYISLFRNIFEQEPYDKVRVIENNRFSADTEVKESKKFEFDSRVYFNTEKRTYEKFVYSTAITKNWNLYQTYKDVTIPAELDDGILDQDLIITPYTQYFTLPSPEKDGYDFLGWQDENGEYLTNIQGYSGVNYISEENNPSKLTAVFAEKKYYYTFENNILKTYKTVPVVTYTDKTMRTILDIEYTPYNTDCVLPIKTVQSKGEVFVGWQYYYLSDKNEFSKNLSSYDFDTKIVAPLALVPEMESTSDYVVPLNGELTSRETGNYRMYLPANERYKLTISTTSSVTLTINQYGSTSNSKTLTIRSGSPQTINLDYYVYNLGSTVYSHGYVTFKVTSLYGSFTAKLVGSTGSSSGSPVVTNDGNTANVGEDFTVLLAKPGYAFAGWYEGDKKISENEFITMQDREMEITAKWVVCPITLEKSIAEAGTVSGVSGTTAIGEEVTITAATKNGYTWVGWYNGDTLLTNELEYTFNMPSKNATYTAKWIKISIDRNLTSAGSVSALSNKYVVGDEVTISASTNNGYTWVGWYNGEKELTKELSYSFTMPSESATFTAKWAKITLSRNNSSAGTITSLNNKYVVGDEVTISATTNSGYTWLGWYNGETELTKNTSYTFSMPEDSETYTATWAAYTLTTKSENTSYGTVTTKNAVRTRAGDEVTITATPKAGYSFVGWYNGNNLLSSDAVYTFNMPFESVTYTAKWTFYTLTTKVGDATAGSVTAFNGAKISVGNEVTIVATPNDGYSFVGWYNGDNLVNSNSTFTFNMPAASLSYTAKWTSYKITAQATEGGSIVSYGATVSFCANDGSDRVMLSQLVTDTIGLKYPTPPLRDGYVFTGWYIDKECTELYNFTQQIKGNMNLYAGWYAMASDNYLSRGIIDIYTYNNSSKVYPITVNGSSSSKYVYTYFTALTSGTYYIYYANGTTTSSYSTYCMIYNVTQNKSIKTNATVSSTSYTNVSFTANVGDVVYIRNYRYNSGNDSKFYVYVTGGTLPTGNGKSLCMVGDISSGVNVSAGQEITINALTNEGYTFLGWFDGEKLVSNQLNIKLIMPSNNISLNAKWINCPIVLEKNIDEAGTITGMSDTSIVGDDITVNAFTNPGYTWLGWYNGDIKLTNSTSYKFTISSERITYTAKWACYNAIIGTTEGGTITGLTDSIVTFNLNGGEGNIDSQHITESNPLLYPEIPTRAGYVFRGWFKDSNCTEIFDFSSEIKYDTTIYAGWQEMASDYYSRQVLDIITNYNTATSYYYFSSSGTSSAKKVYSYFTALTDGTYRIYYKNSSSSNPNGIYLEIKNLTQNSIIKGNVSITTTSYNSVSFTATAGDVICIQNYRVNSSYSATFYLYVEGGKYPSAGGTAYKTSSLNIEAGKSITLTASTKPGYTWLGWYNGNEKIFEEQTYSFAMPEKSINYTAKWSKTTVDKNLSDAGVVTILDDIYYVGDEITITAETNPGYTWLGWYKNGELVTKDLTYGFIMTNENVTYLAYWACYTATINTTNGGWFTGFNSATVTFDLNYEGSTVDSQFIDEIHGLVYPDIPLRSGYIFTGWYTEETCESLFNFTATVEHDVCLYAGWYKLEENCYKAEIIDIIDSNNSANNHCTINARGATSSNKRYTYFTTLTSGTYKIYYQALYYNAGNGTYTTITNVTTNKIIKSNGNVSGGNNVGSAQYSVVSCKANAGDVICIETYSAGSSSSSASTLLVYVEGGALPLAGGKTVASTMPTKIVAGENVEILAETKNGYTWLGWYDGDTLLTNSLSYSFVMPSYSVNYTAKWSKVTIEQNKLEAGTVTELNEKYNLGDEVTIQATTNAGYTWLGWYNGDALLTNQLEYTFNMPINSVTYTAKWAKATVNQNIAEAGEITSLSNTYLPGDKINLTATTFVGHTWLGWYNGNELLTLDKEYLLVIPDNDITITAKWAQDNLLNDFTVEATTTTCVITGIKDKKATSVIIPEYVTGIASNAFKECYHLVLVYNLSSLNIEIGNTANGYVGYYAKQVFQSLNEEEYLYDNGDFTFYVCGDEILLISYNGVEEALVLPNDYNGKTYKVNANAFRDMTINSVTFPNGVTDLGTGAFYGCSKLTSIEIPATIKSIGKEAFYNCTLLDTIKVLGANIEVGASAFARCAITNATVPSDFITHLPKDKLTTVVVSSGDSIPYAAFSRCTTLTSVTLPSTILRIEEDAFYGCSKLKSISIPNKVTAIGETAFAKSGLTTITIYASVTSFGGGVFWDCKSLQSAKIYAKVTEMPSYKDGVNPYTMRGFFYGCTALRNVTLPSTLTILSDSMFFGCTALSNIVVPDSVVTISDNAFSGCSSLKSITIGRGVTTIIQGAFYHCYNLSNAKFLVTTGWRKKDQYGKWSDMEESYMADPAQIAHMLYQSTWYNILQRTE